MNVNKKSLIEFIKVIDNYIYYSVRSKQNQIKKEDFLDLFYSDDIFDNRDIHSFITKQQWQDYVFQKSSKNLADYKTRIIIKFL